MLGDRRGHAEGLRMRPVGLCVLVCIALISPEAALAQKHAPTPSGEELWKAYPLRPTPTTHATPAGGSSRDPAPSGDRQRSGRSRSPAGRAARGDRRSAAQILLALVGPVVLLLLWLRVRARVRTRGSAGAAVVDGVRLREGASGSPADALPGSQHGWTAEIQWRGTGDASRFCVVAEGDADGARYVVAESAPLPQTPDEVTEVQALTPPLERLAESLIAAGWEPLPPTGAWYARRFAWTPVQHHSERSHRPDAAEPPQRGQKVS